MADSAMMNDSMPITPRSGSVQAAAAVAARSGSTSAVMALIAALHS
jgi:hypothetical protein